MIGLPAPQFSSKALFDGGVFKDVDLSTYKGQYVVVFFYPLNFTTVCPTELTQFRDSLSEFKSLNTEVIGISVDSVYSHKKWVKEDLGDLNYPLIGDITKQISRDYGVLLQEQGVATRGTFIIDSEGLIQYIMIHNLNVGRNVSEILRVLRALQSGKLCTAGWMEGESHIKPV